jgi:opacity protein-like surface antigen
MQSIRAGVVLLSALAATAARAEPSPALDRIGLSLGGYYAQTDIRLSASSERYGIGRTSVEPPDGHETLGRARLEFLIGDHQGLEFDYFSFRRSHDQTLQRSFDLGDTHFDVGANLRSRFDFDLGSAAWRWWFGDGPSVFGLGVGAAYYRVKVGLAAEVSANGDSVRVAERYDADAVAPLLTFGWRYAPNETWRFYADASGVKKNGGNLAGHAWNAAAGVEWFPWRNVGVGVEYAITRIRLERDSSRYDADLDLHLHGPAAYLRLRF